MLDNPRLCESLPLTMIRSVECNFCGRVILGQRIGGPGGSRILVEHSAMSEIELEFEGFTPLSVDHMRICPNNGKRWVVEFQQLWIYEVDPVNGEIYDFDGRVV